MKTTIVTVLLALTFIVLGCQTQSTDQEGKTPGALIMCAQDVKTCPDGTQVGRDSNNNCEFTACSDETPIPVEPDGGIGNSPDDKPIPVEPDGGIGTTPTERSYIGTSTDQCDTIRFMCVEGMKLFFDESGCGCEADIEQTPSEGKLQAIDCTDPRPQACTREYMPVCGQVQVECITTPCNPVKQTFGNKCEACANQRTISYTQGECA